MSEIATAPSSLDIFDEKIINIVNVLLPQITYVDAQQSANFN